MATTVCGSAGAGSSESTFRFAPNRKRNGTVAATVLLADASRFRLRRDWYGLRKRRIAAPIPSQFLSLRLCVRETLNYPNIPG
jgi:hypothetical protein